MKELESEFARITVYVKRATKALMWQSHPLGEVHDIGVNIGSSSIGTNGKSPLPVKD